MSLSGQSVNCPSSVIWFPIVVAIRVFLQIISAPGHASLRLGKQLVTAHSLISRGQEFDAPFFFPCKWQERCEGASRAVVDATSPSSCFLSPSEPLGSWRYYNGK